MSSQIKLIYGFILFLLLLFFSLPVSATIQKNNHSENNNTAKNLYLSLKKNNLKAIYHYLSVYQQEHQADPLLIIFSQAKLAYLNQRPGVAIGLYNTILQQKPHFFAAQLELARSYRADRQIGNALLLFRELSQHLPVTSPHYPEITRTITELTAITPIIIIRPRFRKHTACTTTPMVPVMPALSRRSPTPSYNGAATGIYAG